MKAVIVELFSPQWIRLTSNGWEDIYAERGASRTTWCLLVKAVS